MTYDLDWQHPQYAPIYQSRARRLIDMRENPQRVPFLKRHYRDNPADFIEDWGLTFDPRVVKRSMPAKVPFILFPKQREWVEWLMARWLAGEPGVTDKSRDLGLSWLSVATACTLAIFYDGFTAGFGSRKEEYVDKIGSPKSLFWKAREFIRHLPPQFRAGHDPRFHAPHLRITFPETGSTISGEAGDNIGRGDRASIYFIDEAQPLGANVLTVAGWTTIGALRVGDVVTGPAGGVRTVIQIKDFKSVDLYRFYLSDGTFVDSSPNHIWTLDKAWGGKGRIERRTREIAADYAYRSPGGQTQYKYRLPLVEPVEYEPGDPLPLDPYVLGALLGDGSVSGCSIRITSADPELIDELRGRLPGACVINQGKRYEYRLVDPRGPGPTREMMMAVRASGIYGCRSWEKFIPQAYKLASAYDRRLLLQGLLDTDGSATRDGAAGFYSSSRRLAEDVRDLVLSLGGVAKLNSREDARGFRTQYTVHLALPDGIVPFRLARKAQRYKRSHKLSRAIVRVEKLPCGPARCITVDAPDGLYVTDNFTVTHNSAYLERPMLIEASLSATTDCRIDISSANGTNNPFYQKRISYPSEQVFTLHWRDDPRKDQAWYDKQVAELDPVTVAQEIDINYTASVTGVIIDSSWVQSSIDAHVKLGIVPSGARRGALDVADEGIDKNAFISAHGFLVDHAEEWTGVGSDIFYTTRKAFEQCDALGLEEFLYDADGLGAGVRGDARVLNEARAERSMIDNRPARQIVATPFRGSGGTLDPEASDYIGRTNLDYFKNRKAQSWGWLAKRFRETHRAVTDPTYEYDPDMIIAISGNLPSRVLQKLTAELSQPTWGPDNTGKMVVNKSPDGAKSPNLADGVMILMGRNRMPMIISDEAMAA